MGRRLLILPHVGTALGHLIRIGEIIDVIKDEWDEIFVLIPTYADSAARRFLPSTVKLVSHHVRFTVTGPAGRINSEGFLNLLRALQNLAAEINPDFILGDPGIQAGIVGEKFRIPWGIIAHAPYLPFPEVLRGSQYSDIAHAAWNTVTNAIDKLVDVGSVGTFLRWADMREKAHEVISVTPDGLFARNGVSMPCNGTARTGWQVGSPIPCLLTTSSGDNNPLPRALTDYLATQFDQVGVIGPNRPYPNPRVRYLGTTFDIRTLISPETNVITHGGSGTLQHLSGAGVITIVPGDLDQLCNGLLAHAHGKAMITGLESWNARIRAGASFLRNVPWDEYLERQIVSGTQGKPRRVIGQPIIRSSCHSACKGLALL